MKNKLNLIILFLCSIFYGCSDWLVYKESVVFSNKLDYKVYPHNNCSVASLYIEILPKYAEGTPYLEIYLEKDNSKTLISRSIFELDLIKVKYGGEYYLNKSVLIKTGSSSDETDDYKIVTDIEISYLCIGGHK